jgi:hypothetical protein
MLYLSCSFPVLSSERFSFFRLDLDLVEEYSHSNNSNLRSILTIYLLYYEALFRVLAWPLIPVWGLVTLFIPTALG